MALQRQRGNTSLCLCKDKWETCLYDSARKKKASLWLCKDRGETRLYGSAKTEGKHVFMARQKQSGNTSPYKCSFSPQSSAIVQELCESRGGRPGLPVLTSLLVSVDVKIY